MKKIYLRSKKKSKYESCVLCKKQLDILRTEPVTSRRFYVEGVGQLCEECYEKVYGNGQV